MRRSSPSIASPRPLPIVLGIDIGNTNIVVGVFEGRHMRNHWRLTTQSTRTSDEYGLTLDALLKPGRIRPVQAILSSVVPNLTPTFIELLNQRFDIDPTVVGPASPLGLTIGYVSPGEVGADRLVNAAAAFAAFGGPLIIVDFGTATTFCVVTADGTYLGGVIAPGVVISAEALTAKAAKLSKVEWTLPPAVVGRTTASSMQAGLLIGHACMVDGIVERIQRELGVHCRVIATGGLCELIVPAARSIEAVRPHLTLEGLALLAERIRNPSRHRRQRTPTASRSRHAKSAGPRRTRRPP